MSATFGWCLDARHQLCRHTFTNQLGVTHTCDCHCHNKPESEG